MSKTPGKSSVKRHITHTEASRQCQSLFFLGGGEENVCALGCFVGGKCRQPAGLLRTGSGTDISTCSEKKPVTK